MAANLDELRWRGVPWRNSDLVPSVGARSPRWRPPRRPERKHRNRARSGSRHALALALESRAFAELSAFYMYAPLLGLGRRGDGHPALVLPGFATSDRTTAPLRTALRRVGYQAHGWRLGSNRGSNSDTVERTTDHLRTLAQHSGQQVSIIGHSAGGMLGRALARASPELVRQVITVGSPFRFRRGDRSSINAIAELVADPNSRPLSKTPRRAPPAASRPDHSHLLAHRRRRRLAQLHRGRRRAPGERRGPQQPRRAAPPPGCPDRDPRSALSTCRPLGAVRAADPPARAVPDARDVAAGIDPQSRPLNRLSSCFARSLFATHLTRSDPADGDVEGPAHIVGMAIRKRRRLGTLLSRGSGGRSLRFLSRSRAGANRSSRRSRPGYRRNGRPGVVVIMGSLVGWR